MTPELKTYEEKILNAEEKIYELESQLFNEVRLTVASEAEMIQQNARLIAMLDCFISFAECAEQYNYVKPELSDDTKLVIIEGRHPVVERILPPGEKFTSNSCKLENEDDQIIILTGPNMAGVLTVDAAAQAMARAALDKGDKGGTAARAALALLGLKRRLATPETKSRKR